MPPKKLTHVDAKGRARMVDVTAKPVTHRVAVASGRVTLSSEASKLLKRGALAKGDALAVARLAGIQAAKRTSDWIPLCHPVPLERIDVELALTSRKVLITARAEARWSTGVEMEALVAVSAAALALYDMTKAVDRGAVIGEIALQEKRGGRSGTWRRNLVR